MSRERFEKELEKIKQEFEEYVKVLERQGIKSDIFFKKLSYIFNYATKHIDMRFPEATYLILCSIVEGISNHKQGSEFKQMIDWLLDEKLETIANKSNQELQTILENLKEEYLKKYGSRRNFVTTVMESFEKDILPFPDFVIHNYASLMRNQTLDEEKISFLKNLFEDYLQNFYDQYRSGFIHKLELIDIGSKFTTYFGLSSHTPFGSTDYKKLEWNILDFIKIVLKTIKFHFPLGTI